MGSESKGSGEQERSRKWLPGELRTGSPPGWTQSEKKGLGVCVCVPRLEGGLGCSPHPKAHPLSPPLSSHLQSVVSTPWEFWLLCKGVLAGCRDKKAKG